MIHFVPEAPINDFTRRLINTAVGILISTLNTGGVNLNPRAFPADSEGINAIQHDRGRQKKNDQNKSSGDS